MVNPVERLQVGLADRYVIERELGRGGHSVVYLARDTKHGRDVAVKVLRPELASTARDARFRREIGMVAQFSHPHVLPLYDSGEIDGAAFYVMPYVAGETLRDQLQREKQLTSADAVRIIREVGEALSYAHGLGVVHRDIKPENILLANGVAVVADFGIAALLADSSAAGVAGGTPAYMSPEQGMGAAEPDARSDIYSLGCVLYEMLVGHPPFLGTTAQELVSRHTLDPVPSVGAARASVPPALERVVRKALAKQPADRFRTAGELVRALAERQGASPGRVALLFGAASALVLALVYALVIQLGLPDWVFVGAAVLLAIGLPVVLLTAQQERARETAITPRGWFTWRRAFTGGGLAFTSLAGVTVAYMTMRLAGWGPAATLFASGALNEQGRIVLADFANRSGDTSLATAFTEAIRIDLSQSRAVRLLPQDQLRAALVRMQREPHAPLIPEVAREVAVREGLPAVLTGEIHAAGPGFVLSIQLTEPESGNLLAGYRETASDSAAIIPAIDRLSKRLRSRVGESLKSLRAAPPLPRATTASLPALQAFAGAQRAQERGDFETAVRLTKEAIAIDSLFGQAYFLLTRLLTGVEPSTVVQAATRVYQLRDRLPENARLTAAALYQWEVAGNDSAALQAHRRIFELDTTRVDALGSAALALFRMQRYQEAAAAIERALAISSDTALFNRNPGMHRGVRVSNLFNLVAIRLHTGDSAGAQRALLLLRQLHPQTPQRWNAESYVAAAAGRYDSVLALLQQSNSVTTRGNIRPWRIARLKALEGRLREATGYVDEAITVDVGASRPALALEREADMARVRIEFQGSPADQLARMEQALARFPLNRMDPLDRPYSSVALTYVWAGRLDRAREVLAAYEQAVPPEWRRVRVGATLGDVLYLRARGRLAMEEGRLDEALTLLRQADQGYCEVCGLPDLAVVFERRGEVDSAIATYERFVAAPPPNINQEALLALPIALQRLAALHEQRGDRAKAVYYYGRFVDLWRNADPDLQPVVRDARQRMARLSREP